MKSEELDVLINKSLESEPEFTISADFSLKITAIVYRREQWRSDLREYFSLLGITLFLLGIACGIYYYANKSFFNRIVEFVVQNPIPFILIAFILNFILFADRVLLRLLFTRWSKI